MYYNTTRNITNWNIKKEYGFLVNFTNRAEFNVSAINKIGEKLKYNCNKKSEENDKRKIGYFLIERCGWTKIKISQVNISAVKIEAIKNIVDIKIPRSHS